MGKKYYYKIYGLVTQSDINLPLLPLIEKPDKFDFEILCNPVVPKPDDTYKRLNLNLYISDHSIFFQYPAKACFLMQGKNKIIIETEKIEHKNEIYIFFLNQVLPLFLSRFYFIFHGSAISFKNKVIYLSGFTGAGTSTTAYAAIQKGAEFIADQYFAIDLGKQGRPISGLPGIWLWKDALSQFNLHCRNYVPIRKNIEKYFIPVSAIRRKEIKNRTSCIYFLIAGNFSKLGCKKLSNSEKMFFLKNYLFNYPISESCLGKEILFREMGNLCNEHEIFLMENPKENYNSDGIWDIMLNCK